MTIAQLTTDDLRESVREINQLQKLNEIATAVNTLAAGAATSIATSRIVGRLTAGTGAQEALTGTQVTTMLDLATASLKGLAPAFPGNTTTFLRGDGTYAAPAASTPAFSGCMAYNNATASIANNTTTAVFNNTEIFDTASYHDTGISTNRFVAPVTGYYLVHGNIRWASNATGDRYLYIRNSAGGIIAQNIIAAAPGADMGQEVSCIVNLTAADWVEFAVRQSSGGNLTLHGEGAGELRRGMTLLGA